MTLRAQTALLSCLASTALACAEPPPHVFVVLIDTLRVDRVDAFGTRRGATPFLDSLAARSTVFHSAFAQTSWTSPSIASLFTSRYPSQHGISRFGSVLASDEVTLAEALSERGYATGGFSANWLIRKELGYGQGFGRFEAKRGVGPAFRNRSERAAKTGARALAWIDGLAPDSGPVFAYVHVMNPHTPYHPGDEALAWAFEDEPRPDLADYAAHFRERAGSRDPEAQKTLRRLYDAEVRSVDADLAWMFAELDDRGLLENAIVVVVADHGEELWDHGSIGHHHTLFDELIHIPLLIKLPGQTQRRDVYEAVSLIDVAPTVLELVGGSAPGEGDGKHVRPSEGRSLAPVLRGEPDAHGPTPVVAELIQPEIFRRGSHERAVIIGPHKLIAGVQGERAFFDREADPAEANDGSIPEAAKEELVRALDDFVRRMPKTPTAAREVPIDRETREELEALGYVR